MCVWCRGVALGDIDNKFCALYPAYLQFDWLSLHMDEVWDQGLEGLDDQTMWNVLDALLYGNLGDTAVKDERSLDEITAAAHRYWKFNFLTNWGEQFDGYKSFLLCPPDEPVRILSRRFPENMGLRINVTREGVLAASRGFVEWFVEQQETLSKRPGRNVKTA